MSGPALSPTTRELTRRLDLVIDALDRPGCDQTENDLFAIHVRGATTQEGEPVFTDAVLKMAFLELLQACRDD